MTEPVVQDRQYHADSKLNHSAQFLHTEAATPAARPLRDRFAFFGRAPPSMYGNGIAWLAEYLGTTFFLFLALSGEQVAFGSLRSGYSLDSEVAMLLYGSISFAVAFTVATWVFFRITSGLFNPAIAFGMCLVGSMTWLRAVVVIIAQFLGAMTAAGLVDAIFPGPLVPTMQLSTATSTARGFFIEFFLTMCLVLMVFAISNEKHKGNHFIIPIGLGIAMCSVELSDILFTGGSLNPARAFAVALASHQWPKYHWLYWLAPVLGAVPAAVLWKLIRILEYETAEVRSAVTNVASPSSQPVARQQTQATPTQQGSRLSAVNEPAVEKHGSV